LWCLRTSVNKTLGISPFQVAFGRIGVEPLQLLCDDWIGKRQLPLDIAKALLEYLQDLERKLLLASENATEHAAREQSRYTHVYNLRSYDKIFHVKYVTWPDGAHHYSINLTTYQTIQD